MLQIILRWDEQFTRGLNGFLPHNSFFDGVFSFLSLQGASIGIWVVFVVLLIAFEEMKNKKFIFDFVVAVGATSLLVNLVLKNLFQRARPDFLVAKLPYVCPTDFSFPSGHAAVAFAAASVLSHYDRKRSLFYFTVATLISLSRIYLGCHFFFDVFVGGIIGYLISRLFLRFNFWKQ